MKRSEIRVWNLIPGHSDPVYSKKDADKYINRLETALLKMAKDEFGVEMDNNSEEEIDRVIEWAINR